MTHPYDDYDHEFCNRSGAERIAKTIKDYWAARGADVEVHLVQAEFTPQMRSGRFDVRSDIKNGLPRKLHPAIRP